MYCHGYFLNVLIAAVFCQCCHKVITALKGHANKTEKIYVLNFTILASNSQRYL
jgi:hypothetical protein